MPFDDTSHGGGGGGGGCGCDCDVCHDSGFVHVMRFLDGRRLVEAIACPAECEVGLRWSDYMARQEEKLRALRALLGGDGDGRIS